MKWQSEIFRPDGRLQHGEIKPNRWSCGRERTVTISHKLFGDDTIQKSEGCQRGEG